MEVHIFGITFDLLKIINPAFYIFFILCLNLLVRRILNGVFVRAIRGKKVSEHQKQRVQTIHEMLKSILRYVTLILIFLVVLASCGVNVTSLLAGLGVLTAILGLAFQDMIKDMIAGVAIITEGQFSVGDTIEVNGFQGQVLSVGLKTTQLKNYRGEVKIISNRNIDNLTNYSKFDVLTEVTVETGFEVPEEKVVEALENVKRRLDGKVSEMTGEISISPISNMDESGVSYTLACTSAPEDASTVQTALREVILEEFAKAKIKPAYRKIIVEGK